MAERLLEHLDSLLDQAGLTGDQKAALMDLLGGAYPDESAGPLRGEDHTRIKLWTNTHN
jgi:hypothetical protein